MTQRDDMGSTGRAPEDIQREIEHTRAVMKQDVREIGEKFTPDQIKENAKGILSDAKQEGATMMRDAKDAAVGSLRSARDRATDAVSETAHDLTDRARHAGELAGDYARRAGGYAQPWACTSLEQSSGTSPFRLHPWFALHAASVPYPARVHGLSCPPHSSPA